jgi:diguanylate cyclase (GGDEF)-like protein
MKKWIFSYLQLDKNIESHTYRKRVTSKFILLLSFIILISLMIGNFISNNSELFYINIGLLISMILMLSLPGRQRQFASYIILHVMALGILLVVHFNQGQEYTPIWYFLYIFLVMPLYGHRTGFKIALCFLIILLLLMFTFVGKSISVMEFVRFTMVACFTLFFAYFIEMLISRTLRQLINAKAQLEQLTKIDALTNLYNRRHFDELLPQKMNSAKRNRTLFALVIIDIDFFKNYNDSYGHPAGDVALIELAKLFSNKMQRSNDAVFRLGGEEFALLYQSNTESEALKIMEALRVAVEELHYQGTIEKQITVSAGLLVIHPQQDILANSAYQLADDLMYQAKNSGRNTVVQSST